LQSLLKSSIQLQPQLQPKNPNTEQSSDLNPDYIPMNHNITNYSFANVVTSATRIRRVGLSMVSKRQKNRRARHREVYRLRNNDDLKLKNPTSTSTLKQPNNLGENFSSSSNDVMDIHGSDMDNTIFAPSTSASASASANDTSEVGRGPAIGVLHRYSSTRQRNRHQRNISSAHHPNATVAPGHDNDHYHHDDHDDDDHDDDDHDDDDLILPNSSQDHTRTRTRTHTQDDNVILTRSSIHMATRNASTRLLDLSPHDQLPSLDFIALAENRERESSSVRKLYHFA
jgi:hypothetical protein